MTVTAIKTNIQRWLNRVGDTTVTDVDDEWLRMAHKWMQRKHNFTCMETTLRINNLVANTDSYTAPTTDIAGNTVVPKESKWHGFLWNNTTSKIVKFYEQTSIENILALRHNTSDVVLDPSIDPSLSYFAYHAGNIEFWPMVTSEIAAYHFRIPGWKFLSLPGDASDDWFTTHGEDCLLYSALLESVPYFGAPPARTLLWNSRRLEAWNDLMAMDVQKQWAGPMRARG